MSKVGFELGQVSWIVNLYDRIVAGCCLGAPKSTLSTTLINVKLISVKREQLKIGCQVKMKANQRLLMIDAILETNGIFYRK